MSKAEQSIIAMKKSVENPIEPAVMCRHCDFKIRPPVGKVFYCADSGSYCAGCFTYRSMYGEFPKLVSV